jgi:hypothetical protein|tara:strand:- start:56 stop:205 length:150 start_codon:yes stop_codon:yes gene_type:complete
LAIEGCDWFVFVDCGKINQPYLEDGENMNKDPEEDQYNPEDNTGKIKGN